MKFLRVLSVVALAALIAATGAYAETQNVKVSGDLAVRGFWRDNYSGLNSFASQQEDGLSLTGLGAQGDKVGVDRPNSQWFMSTTELQIDADLTDNVSTCIRLLNQRDWNVARSTQMDNQMNGQMGTIGSGGFGHSYAYVDDPNEFAVDLELAYLTLKNFLYSPLTVTIGRQNLWFGKGFIVGANQRIRNAANFGNYNWAAATRLAYVQPLSAPEYTSQNAFDSVKAVLDFDPWTLTGIYSKIWGNSIQADDGVDLWGANVGYKFDAYKGEGEGYWFYKRDEQVRPWTNINAGANNIHTLGIRGSLDPIDILSLYAEFAGQFGTYMADPLQGNNRPRVAGALDVGGELRYFTDKWAWKPKLGTEFIWYSGNAPEDRSLDGNLNSARNRSGTYTGWDPMFRGKTDSLIREFVGRYYYSATYPFEFDRYYNSADNSFQNQYQVIFRGSLQPMDSLKLTGNLNLFWNQQSYRSDIMKARGYVGTELDVGATWDYTEDVQFGLACGWFMPGDVYRIRDERINPLSGDNTATDVVATVKVSF